MPDRGKGYVSLVSRGIIRMPDQTPDDGQTEQPSSPRDTPHQPERPEPPVPAGPDARGSGVAAERRPPASRRTAGVGPAVPRPAPARAHEDPDRLGRHVWVLVPDGDRLAGLLSQWRREPDGSWSGLVVYVAQTGGHPTLLQTWISREHLEPAAPSQ